MKSIYTKYASEFYQNNLASIMPQSVEIDLSNSCNQDCIYCNSKKFREKNKSSPLLVSHYTRLIDGLAAWSRYNGGNLKTITFVGGGEPTMKRDYEYIIKKAIDKGFFVSLITNGVHLDKLLNIDVNTLRKISWIGVDVDSGVYETYNRIRRPNNKDHFHIVRSNMEDLASIGVPIDMKVLLMDENSNAYEIQKLFEYAGWVRMIYFRPAVVNGKVYEVSQETFSHIRDLSQSTGIRVKYNTTRRNPRTYKKCYSLYLLPVFCSDGKIYTCCENRGNPKFSLGSWVGADLLEFWGTPEHYKIFKQTDVSLCEPCRPNCHNNEIQYILDNKICYDDLFF